MDNFLSNEPYSVKIGHSWRPVAQFEVWKFFEKKSKIFWKCRKLKNFRFLFQIFSELKLSHRALGMSDFDARGLIRQEIIHIFRILFKYKSQNYLHTCGTHKTYHAKNAIFVPVVCSLSCAGVRTNLGVRATLKFSIRAFQRRVLI